MKRVIASAVLLVATCFTGCSDGRPEIVPVSGQVLIDGEPLTYGFVRFSPGDGRVSMGRLDDNGRFRLTCYEPGDGAIVGTHRVAVLTHEVIGDAKIKWHAPRKYADYATSGLTQEISQPTDSIVIHLTWGDGKRRRETRVDMDVRIFVDEQEIGATAAAHGAALIRKAPVERRAASIALATGTPQFEIHAIESI